MVLSVLCGLAILLAGGLWLVQLSNASNDVPKILGVGDRATFDDGSSVTLVSVERDGPSAIVTIEAGQADVQTIAAQMRVVVSGRNDPIEATGPAETAAGSSSVAVLSFSGIPADATAPVLRLLMPGRAASWVLK
jgi:hypothetical protein